MNMSTPKLRLCAIYRDTKTCQCKSQRTTLLALLCYAAFLDMLTKSHHIAEVLAAASVTLHGVADIMYSAQMKDKVSLIFVDLVAKLTDKLKTNKIPKLMFILGTIVFTTSAAYT